MLKVLLILFVMRVLCLIIHHTIYIKCYVFCLSRSLLVLSYLLLLSEETLLHSTVKCNRTKHISLVTINFLKLPQEISVGRFQELLMTNVHFIDNDTEGAA